MDLLSIIGVVLGFGAIVGGIMLHGNGPGALWGPAAFVIVFVGTTAAILVQTPMATFKHGLKILRWVFKPPAQDPAALIARIVEWSNAARKQGLLALESSAEAEADPFVRKGLQMLVDGAEPDMIRNTLDVEMGNREHFDLAGAKVFEGMGIYAPTLGIIGAVMGLMEVMANLADPSKLGSGIAAAFVATIYGIATANLFMLPIASKLKSVIADQSRVRELIVEGLVSISQGDNPRNIEAKLQGYLH
ncbi:MAG: flagellar motor protein [Nevskia sp.]|nr:flagellar motor protein [Nevskia sp.]